MTLDMGMILKPDENLEIMMDRMIIINEKSC